MNEHQLVLFHVSSPSLENETRLTSQASAEARPETTGRRQRRQTDRTSRLPLSKTESRVGHPRPVARVASSTTGSSFVPQMLIRSLPYSAHLTNSAPPRSVFGADTNTYLHTPYYSRARSVRVVKLSEQPSSNLVQARFLSWSTKRSVGSAMHVLLAQRG
jgi:hypothetical protein